MRNRKVKQEKDLETYGDKGKGTNHNIQKEKGRHEKECK